jgi:hypothetical protein
VAPTVTIDPDDTLVSVDPNGRLTVVCNATGTPEPTIKWVIGDDEREVPGSKVELENIVKDTTVKCVATNKAGEAERTLQVQVSGIILTQYFISSLLVEEDLLRAQRILF